MVTTLKYCPLTVAVMVAEAHDPKSNARRSPVRAAEAAIAVLASVVEG